MSGPVGAPQGGWQGPALPPRPANAPPAFHLLAKPTGAICNLDCAYCFFLDKEVFYPGSTFRMDNSVLEQYLRQNIRYDLDERAVRGLSRYLGLAMQDGWAPDRPEVLRAIDALLPVSAGPGPGPDPRSR